MFKIVHYLCLFAIVLQQCFASVPFQTCRKRDPNFTNCLKFAIEDALLKLRNYIPEYGLSSIQPIVVGSWMVPAKPPLTYDQVYKHSEMFNYPFSVIKNLRAKIDNSSFFLSFNAYNPEIVTRFNYKFNNAILNGEDLSSEGQLVYIYRDFEFEVSFTGAIVSTKAGTKIEITQSDMNIISMRFSADFHSKDTVKAEKLKKYFSDNAQYIVDEEKVLYGAAYAEIFKGIANTIFSKFSVYDLFPDFYEANP